MIPSNCYYPTYRKPDLLGKIVGSSTRAINIQNKPRASCNAKNNTAQAHPLPCTHTQ